MTNHYNRENYEIRRYVNTAYVEKLCLYCEENEISMGHVRVLIYDELFKGWFVLEVLWANCFGQVC